MPHVTTSMKLEAAGPAVTPIAGNGEFGGACWNGDIVNPKALYGVYAGGEMRCYRTIGDHHSLYLESDSVEYLSTIVAGTFAGRRSCGLTYIGGTIYAIVVGGDALNSRTGTFIYRDTGGGGEGPWVQHGVVSTFPGVYASHRDLGRMSQSTEILVTGSGRWWVNHLRCNDTAGRVNIGLAYSDSGGATWTIAFDYYDNQIGTGAYDFRRTQPTWGKSAGGFWWWTANGNTGSALRYRIDDATGALTQVNQGGGEDDVGGNFAPGYQFSINERLHRVRNGYWSGAIPQTVESTGGEPDAPPTWTAHLNWGALPATDHVNPGVHLIGPPQRPVLAMVQAGQVLGIGKAQGGPTTGFIGFGTF